MLKQLLTGVIDGEERYGLNWHGKRRARQAALSPRWNIAALPKAQLGLRDATGNLIVEGDNLEVLKLFQKSYAGRVKLIYIDPPYNTGKDFIYRDKFSDSINGYLELTGEISAGRKFSSNSETSGRFHTSWLNMIFPN